jgi:pilus assembly protein CpaD
MSVRILSLIGLAAVALTGCETPVRAVPPLTPDRWAPQVREQTEFLELQATGDQTRLTPVQGADLDRFLQGYAARGHGPLIVSTPAGAPNTEAARRLAGEASGYIRTTRGPGVQFAVGTYAETRGADAPVILAYRRAEVIVPDCPPASSDFTETARNGVTPDFGCAVATNVAMMVGDPGDLLGNRELGPADLARRQLVLENYRLGQPTAAQRTDDESGALSTAVQ